MKHGTAARISGSVATETQPDAISETSPIVTPQPLLPEAPPLTEPRDIEAITEELLTYKQIYAEAAYEIGKLLLEAKDQLAHGEWLNWLRDRINFSERTAHRFMKLAKSYPDSTALANLGYSKALCLLALPKIERSAFLKKTHKVNGVEKNVGEMSARELENAVREHKSENTDEASAASPAAPKTKGKSKSDADLQYVQDCIDEMLDSIETLIDNPASYNDLTTSLRALCESILLQSSAPIPVNILLSAGFLISLNWAMCI